MEKKIIWRAPTGDEDHEVPEGATVKFLREDGKELLIRFDEDESVKVEVKSESVEFSQSYFMPEPERMSIEEVLEQGADLEIYTHTMSSDMVGVEPHGEIKEFGEGEDVKKALFIFSCFPKEWLPEDPKNLQQVYSPVFGTYATTGDVIQPGDPDLESIDESEMKVHTVKPTRVSVDDYRSMSIPGTDVYKKIVMETLRKLVDDHGWKYVYQIEERGDGKKTYVYARGC